MNGIFRITTWKLHVDNPESISLHTKYVQIILKFKLNARIFLN